MSCPRDIDKTRGLRSQRVWDLPCKDVISTLKFPIVEILMLIDEACSWGAVIFSLVALLGYLFFSQGAGQSMNLGVVSLILICLSGAARTIWEPMFEDMEGGER